jgi:aldehyde dehydrogenase (NAD+)
MTSDDALPRYSHFIDGRFVPPASGEFLPTEDPYSGQTWAWVARGNREDAEAAVAAARRAFDGGAWPGLTPSERGRLLWRLGDLIVANAERLADIERRDNGKLAAEVVAQVRYMGDYFRYYAGLADKVQSVVIPTDKKGVSPTRATRRRAWSPSSRPGTRRSR